MKLGKWNTSKNLTAVLLWIKHKNGITCSSNNHVLAEFLSHILVCEDIVINVALALSSDNSPSSGEAEHESYVPRNLSSIMQGAECVTRAGEKEMPVSTFRTA